MALPAAAAEVSGKTLRVATVVLCGILFVLGLHILIGVATSSTEAGGYCLLYADHTGYGPGSVCGYIYTVAVLFQLLFCLTRAVCVAVILTGVLKKEEQLSSRHVMIGCTVTDVTACLLTLVTGGLVSHGLRVMCTGIFHPYSDRCGSSDFYSSSTNSFVTHYYTRLNIAQVTAWLSLIVWILLVVVDVILLSRTEILTDLRDMVLQGVGVSRDENSSNSTDNAASQRDPGAKQSQRFRGMLVFRSRADDDTGSGPRTPPPRRPCPPRPPPPAEAGASAKPLMERC
ncbi:uncharacterized protein LOC143281652 [Babylonia areolata]|uniref:uncharacterized protein LOC143281652 n=1 Tax=Babylonia areolata TaxID=304850 RepID=UPI003FD5A0EB